jgi:hypothetical protein
LLRRPEFDAKNALAHLLFVEWRGVESTSPIFFCVAASGQQTPFAEPDFPQCRG